ncbi:MAG: universal stress protein [Thermodesulfobacteriota bacterium]
MIKKILWASDGSEDSIDALEYVKNIAQRCKSETLGLYVIPDYFEVDVKDQFPEQEYDLIAKWIKETESKESDRLKDIAKDFESKGLNFDTQIAQGVPHLQIIQNAQEAGADLIVLGKGRAKEKLLGATALKVIRRSPIPVMVARKSEGPIKIKNILVPTDLFNIRSRDLLLTAGLAEYLDLNITSLNIVEVGNKKYPPEVVERLRGNSYNNLTKQVDEANLGIGVNTVVKTGKNAVKGIINYASDNDTDIIFMNTYGGGEFRREEFIGSVAERVIQEAPCPVITVKPE